MSAGNPTYDKLLLTADRAVLRLAFNNPTPREITRAAVDALWSEIEKRDNLLREIDMTMNDDWGYASRIRKIING